MCGLVGYMDLRNERRAEQHILHRMSETIAHRGPDSCGYFLEENVGLGFRRLNVIDLETGEQPIFNEDRSLVLLCNGEIFNYCDLKDELVQREHVFYTKTDVEVLLHLHEEAGTEFLTRLNGQFAFVIYNRKEKSLFIARDQFGICPFYYTIVDDMFIFASEIKAILKHPSSRHEIDLTGLDQILSLPGSISPRTMFRGIKSLPCGHYMLIRNADLSVVEYWDLEYPMVGEINNYESESYYVERLKDLFERAVKLRLQADVPVGYFLSGGLDSSLISAMIQKAAPGAKRRSFSISFSDKEICEAKYQRLMAKSVDSEHHEILFDENEILKKLSRAVYHSECPLKETYNTCSLALSEAAKQASVSVVLNGEGADELFAGYVGYRFDRFRFENRGEYSSDAILEEENRSRLWGDKDIFYEKDQFEFQEIKRELYSSTANELFEEFDCINFHIVNKERLQGRHFVHQRSYLDFKLRLAGHLIADHGDRMAMANSVEARYPFLDINLVEFTKEIPPDLKLNRYTEKYILKRLAENLIPHEIIKREKFAFVAPGSPWLLRQNVEWVNDVLSYESIKEQGYFNPEFIERLKKRYSEEDHKINVLLEDDLLIIVLTFGLLLKLFELPNLR
jgi:asparagine synthase (glutamine-hydrolysing)